MVQAPKQLKTTYMDVKHWEELFNFINKNGGPKELYILTAMFKCTLKQEEKEKEYLQICKHGQIINDPYCARLRTTIAFQML
jgi:hypothetical protein